MKSNITLFKLALTTIIVGVLPKAAYAGSILVMAPSTSKIEVIGTEKSSSIEYMGKKKTASSKPAGAQKTHMKPETKTAKSVPIMPKMRTGEVELPVIPVSQTESN